MPFDPLFQSSAKLRQRPLSGEHLRMFEETTKKHLRKQPFKPPRKRFDSTSEQERQQIAIDRANGFKTP